MTLVLASVDRWYVLQVSDRQLTTSAGRPFDDAANKAILFCASDAQVCVGYSGDAYIGGVTTDRWLAEILWGSPIPDGLHRGRPAAFRVSSAHRATDLGQAIKRLSAKLAAARVRHIEILMVGWQISGSGWRPVWIEIRTMPVGIRVTKSERHFYWTRHAGHGDLSSRHYPGTLHQIPDSNPLTSTEVAELGENLGRRPDPAVRTQLLWDAIRLASEHNPIVGQECMSVILPYPAHGDIEIRFLSKSGHTAQVGPWVLQVTFTPWVLAPTTLSAPAVTNSDSTIPFGWNHVVLRPPPASAAPRGFVTFSQPRRRWP